MTPRYRGLSDAAVTFIFMGLLVLSLICFIASPLAGIAGHGSVAFVLLGMGVALLLAAFVFLNWPERN